MENKQITEQIEIQQQESRNKAGVRMSEILVSATELQVQGFFAEEIEGKGRGYCAIGLLSLYAGNDPEKYSPNSLWKFYGTSHAEMAVVVCPECGRRPEDMLTIAHLNDYHRWTFMQIGMWLKQKGW